MKKLSFSIYKIPFTLFFFILCFTLSAQKTIIKGIVKDSITSKPIEGVVLQAIDGKKVVSFSITDKTGSYKLSFENNLENILFVLRHIAYHEKTLKIRNKSQQINFLLSSKEIMIREVTIKAPEVIHKKDTVSFNVATFQSAADYTIEDVIKKMPGIEVSKDGGISYQGKAISKFNIEGLDMLGGKYALATKNIEAKVVNRVEVMENYQEIKQLRGKEYSDKVAMNLKLKKETIVKPMGTVELGGGYSVDEWLYHLGINGMVFMPKFQLLGVVKTNNLGKSLRPEFKIILD